MELTTDVVSSLNIQISICKETQYYSESNKYM